MSGTAGEAPGPTLDFEGWSCPLPLRDHPMVVLGHGGGGKLSAELIEHLFLPELAPEADPSRLMDAAVLATPGGRLALSTDSFVVRPLFFPGGCIGDLAVHGTVNDVSMAGAMPLYLTAGFIVEEGLELATLARIVAAMGRAARAAGVALVAGDTKVVERGRGDGVYINTTGVGWLPEGVDPRPERARPGDVVLLSGDIGDHGMAVMSVREGLAFDTEIVSDSAALNGLVAAMLAACPGVRALRDPTRGGLAATLNELARAAGLGIAIDERRVPVKPAVAAACDLLGLDPFYVANEGKLVAVVPPEGADAVLAAMRGHPLGASAVAIGHVVAEHPGLVVARTGIGGRRVVDMALGEQLPRIC